MILRMQMSLRMGTQRSVRLLGLLAGLLLLAGAAVAAPKSFHADYSALRNGERLGVASLHYSAQTPGRSELATSTRGTEGLAAAAGVSIEERSLLDWSRGRPETASYRYTQKMAWKTRERRIDVDPSAGTVLRSDKDGGREYAYQPGVLDRHAVTVALMNDLAAGKTGEFSYPVAEREGVALQRYRSFGVENIDTALGRQRAVRVDRLRDDGNGRQTTVWFGVDRGYLPLRLLQVEPDGESIELRISGVR